MAQICYWNLCLLPISEVLCHLPGISQRELKLLKLTKYYFKSPMGELIDREISRKVVVVTPHPTPSLPRTQHTNPHIHGLICNRRKTVEKWLIEKAWQQNTVLEMPHTQFSHYRRYLRTKGGNGKWMKINLWYNDNIMPPPPSPNHQKPL